MTDPQFARYLASLDAVRITIDAEGCATSHYPIRTLVEYLIPRGALPIPAECAE